jgi:hypothetical protein
LSLIVAGVLAGCTASKPPQNVDKQRQTVAGAAYLVVPIAMSASDEVRFIRIGEH